MKRISNSTERVVSTRIRSDSPIDDDYDSTIDEDNVSDKMASDGGSDITNHPPDADNLADNASTSSISSVSSPSSDEAYMSSPRENLHDTNSNQSLLLTQEEEFLNRSFVDPEVLLSKIRALVKRVRKFVRMIHKSSNLNRYFTKEIKAKVASLNAQITDPSKPRYGHWICEFDGVQLTC